MSSYVLEIIQSALQPRICSIGFDSWDMLVLSKRMNMFVFVSHKCVHVYPFAHLPMPVHLFIHMFTNLVFSS